MIVSGTRLKKVGGVVAPRRAPRRWGWCVAAALALSGGFGGLLPASAGATFPGANGMLAVTSEKRCDVGQRYIEGFSSRGRPLAPLTRPCTDDDRDDLTVQEPDFSPDGRTFAFSRVGGSSGRLTQIGVSTADGAQQTLLPISGASSPSLSPDGERVAYEVYPGTPGSWEAEIWTANLDGSDQRRLVPIPTCLRDGKPGPCLSVTAPRWSPNGKWISVSVATVGDNLRGTRLRRGLWIVDARTGAALRRIARGGDDVDWSPDSRRLLYRTGYQKNEAKRGASGGNIYIVDATGKHRRRLVHRRNAADIEPTWSPDGRSIAWIGMDFSAGTEFFSIFTDLWRMRLGGGTPRRVAALPSPQVEEGWFTNPDLAWQPRPRSPMNP